MNHKQLLALFLCFVMILSSRIVSIENDKVVSVKNVNNNLDKYTIESIVEENDKYKINIFYPVTKYENVNNLIMEKINEYKNEFEKSDYISNIKELSISFESFEYNQIESFKFNVKSNVGITHDASEVFTVVYKEDQIIDIDYLNNINSEFIDELFKACRTRIKDNPKIKEYINEEWLEEGLTKDANVFSNFIFSKKSIIILFNPNIVAPTVAGIIEVEVPYEVLGFTIE